MSKETRTVGIAFLLSILLVAGAAAALNLLVAPTQASGIACRSHDTVSCLL